jgi:hypothetical protein
VHTKSPRPNAGSRYVVCCAHLTFQKDDTPSDVSVVLGQAQFTNDENLQRQQSRFGPCETGALISFGCHVPFHTFPSLRTLGQLFPHQDQDLQRLPDRSNENFGQGDLKSAYFCESATWQNWTQQAICFTRAQSSMIVR